MLNIKKIRNDFNQLKTKINKKNIVYFDNAATSLKPNILTEEIKKFYENNNSNIHRAFNTLSNNTTDLYEKSRENIASFLNSKPEEIVFCDGATRAINIVINGINFKKGDKILLSSFEHHSNLLPFFNLKNKKKCEIEYIKTKKNLEIDLEKLKNQITKNTKFISFCHISNVLGIILPIEKMIKIIREKEKKFKTKIFILVDCSQSLYFKKIDFKKLDCDFLVFSSHKVLGEFGLGFLVGKFNNLENLKIDNFGGGSILNVTENNFKLLKSPYKFESGTTKICQVITFSKVLNYIKKIEIKNIQDYEKDLIKYFKKSAKLFCQKNKKTKFYFFNNQSLIFSFHIENLSSFDICHFLDNYGIIIRSGFLCSENLIRNVLKQKSLNRVSLNFYNTKEEIDYFFLILEKLYKKFN